MAQEPEDLSDMMRKLQEEYTRAGLKINFAKTEYLATVEEEIEDLQIGDNVTIKGKYKTRTAIRQLSPIWWDTHLSMKIKIQIYKS